MTRTTISPSRSLLLLAAAAVLAALLVALLSTPSGEARGRDNSSMSRSNNNSKTARSDSIGCKMKYEKGNQDSYGCFRLYTPRSIVLGEPFKVTVRFLARKTMKATLAIDNRGENTKGKYALKRRRTVKKGKWVVYSVMLELPTSLISFARERDWDTTRLGATAEWGSNYERLSNDTAVGVPAQ